MSLKGKAALVTGGSRGIGRAIAIGLAEVGVDIIVASRKLPDLEKAVERIKGLGGRAVAVQANIGKMDEVSNLVERAKEAFGRVDILVNNAATNLNMAPLLEADERAWDAVMNPNLKGLFFLSQGIARIMKEQGGGNIINIASIEGLTPTMLPIYGISKAGVIMATKFMAKQWGKYNIRVNSIAPGITRTDFSQPLIDNPQILKALMSNTPLARVAEPEEMVGAVLYLASDAASYVTGQIIAIDGGITI
jgi:NAD(P)-dependent dehydrogenase (short-subunit alcohol dehydrogenase family)